MGWSGINLADIAFHLMGGESWEKDPFIYPHPGQGLSLQKAQRLRIGVWSSNGFVHLPPPAEGEFTAAQERLRNAGVELAELHGPDISQAWK